MTNYQTSKLNSLLDAVVKTIQALNCQLNGESVPVVKRKLPKKEQSVDPAVQITVCASEDVDEQKYHDFTGAMRVTYVFEITIISPNNDDQLTNLDIYTEWRESIRMRFKKPPFVVYYGTDENGALLPVTVFQMRVLPGKFLDRKLISDNYDYQMLRLEIVVIEGAS